MTAVGRAGSVSWASACTRPTLPPPGVVVVVGQNAGRWPPAATQSLRQSRAPWRRVTSRMEGLSGRGGASRPCGLAQEPLRLSQGSKRGN